MRGGSKNFIGRSPAAQTLLKMDDQNVHMGKRLLTLELMKHHSLMGHQKNFACLFFL